MTETAFEPSDGAAFAIALLNTWDELEPDPECLRDVGFVQRLLARHGLADAARVAREQDVDWLRGLRERLARAWDAANEETAVAELNTILAGASAQPWLARDDGRRGVPLRPPRRAGPGVRRRARRPRAARGDRGRTLAAVRPLRRRAVPVRLHRPDAQRRAPLLLPALRRPGGAPGVPQPRRSRLLTSRSVISSIAFDV